MSQASTRGPLIIIGGAEDRERECLVLRAFVRAVGGTKARIAIMTAATGYPEEVGEEYRQIFERLGAESAYPIHTQQRDDSEQEATIRLVQQATGIFFTGGDQSRIVQIIKDTSLEAAIHERHNAGAVVGGTSAGAAMMPDQMIIGGASVSNPSIGVLDMGPGMGFMLGIVVDQHFAQWGRIGRLLAALVGGLTAIVLQPQVVMRFVNEPDLATPLVFIKGVWMAMANGDEENSGIADIDRLLSRGGMDSMLYTLWIIIGAVTFGTLMEEFGLLAKLINPVLLRARTTGMLFLTTVCTAIGLNIFAGD